MKLLKPNSKGPFKNKGHDIESDRPTDFCNFLSSMILIEKESLTQSGLLDIHPV